MMLALALFIAGAVWALALVVALAMCRAAKVGDQAAGPTAGDSTPRRLERGYAAVSSERESEPRGDVVRLSKWGRDRGYVPRPPLPLGTEKN